MLGVIWSAAYADGMAVGDVPLDRINDGRDVRPGDVVVGLESNGIHSNGLSLARHAFCH